MAAYARRMNSVFDARAAKDVVNDNPTTSGPVIDAAQSV